MKRNHHGRFYNRSLNPLLTHTVGFRSGRTPAMEGLWGSIQSIPNPCWRNHSTCCIQGPQGLLGWRRKTTPSIGWIWFPERPSKKSFQTRAYGGVPTKGPTSQGFLGWRKKRTQHCNGQPTNDGLHPTSLQSPFFARCTAPHLP